MDAATLRKETLAWCKDNLDLILDLYEKYRFWKDKDFDQMLKTKSIKVKKDTILKYIDEMAPVKAHA